MTLSSTVALGAVVGGSCDGGSLCYSRSASCAASANWQRVLSSDLPALNVQLQREGVQGLRVAPRVRDSIGID